MGYATETVSIGEGNYLFIQGSVIVSDPCYDDEVMEQAAPMYEVMPGMYEAYVKMFDEGSWGQRVGVLGIRHLGTPVQYAWEVLPDRQPVDSGQMMILDSEAAKQWGGGEFTNLAWGATGPTLSYQNVCNITLNTPLKAGLLSNVGVVSETGIGDGMYPVYVLRDEKNQIYALEVRFLEDEEY